MISKSEWKRLWETRWEAEENDASDEFYTRVKDMADEFCEIIEDIAEEGEKEYDADLIKSGLEVVGGAVDLYGSGMLVLGFFLSLQQPGKEEAEVFAKIEQRDEEYFSKALGSFFPVEMREEYVEPYMDLFHARGRDGALLLQEDDRDDLWRWMHSLVRKMAEYIEQTYPQFAHGVRGLKDMGK